MRIEWSPEDVESAADARAYAYSHLHNGDKVSCLSCDQDIYLWPRTIHASMASSMIQIYRAKGTGWAHLSSVLGRPAVFTISLHYWGLLESKRGRSEDGNSNGIWRITQRGERWVNDEIKVPKYAMTYNKQVWRYEGPPWSVTDALGKKFNYNELMGRTA